MENQKPCLHCGAVIHRPLRQDRAGQYNTVTQWRKRRFCSPACAADHKRPSMASRFWPRVDRRGDNECWPWKQNFNRDGYGRFRGDAGERLLAHRVAYALNNGPIPEGLLVCHSCDNPPCCNPKHLWPGSPRENNDDKMQKGRAARLVGEQIGNSKLTAEIALKILRSTEPASKVAAIYGVSAGTVYDIRAGRRWTHLHDGAAR